MSSESRSSANLLLDFLVRNGMDRFINVPTRGNNILDLLITNISEIILDVKAERTSLSDHNWVTVSLGCHFQPDHTVSHDSLKGRDFDFSCFDFSRTDFPRMESYLESVSWNPEIDSNPGNFLT